MLHTKMLTTPIFFNQEKSEFFHEYHQIFIVMDENTQRFCYTKSLAYYPVLQKAHPIVIPSGEKHKDLTHLAQIWHTLTTHHADKNSLVVVLAGGLLCDLAGFAAATFKRGIPFVFLPTTLLAQIDAAIGGKTAINFEGYKNQLGVFAAPKAVFIHPFFLETLPPREFFSAYMEFFKYLLLAPTPNFHWQNFQMHAFDAPALLTQIQYCLTVKQHIVAQDPFEENPNHLRKGLNLGHTAGHALESYFLAYPHAQYGALLHGEAVGYGLYIELLWAQRLGYNTQHSSILHFLKNLLQQNIPLDLPSAEKLWPYLLQDKKNQKQQVQFVCLTQVGRWFLSETPKNIDYF